MHARARRGVTAGLGACLVMAAGLTACGGGSEPVETGAGAAPTETPANPVPAAEDPIAEEPVATTEPPAPAPADGPSPVDGLTPSELREVVEAPRGTEARRRTGPVAEQVTVGGRTVWRLTVPGAYELLSARITVAVGGTDVGEGIVTPDLGALVAVVADPAALVAGATVAYRWGAGEPNEAGRLEVVR